MSLTKLRLYFRISFVTYDNHICYTPCSLSKFADYAGYLFFIFPFESFSYSFLLSFILIFDSLKIFSQSAHRSTIDTHYVILLSSFNFIYIFSKGFKIFPRHTNFRIIKIFVSDNRPYFSKFYLNYI